MQLLPATPQVLPAEIYHIPLWMRSLMVSLLLQPAAIFGESQSAVHEPLDIYTWARSRLVEQAVIGFRRLTALSETDYEKLAGHKAAAICITWSPEPHVSFWGAAWEYESIEEAGSRAMAQCEKAKVSGGYNRDCQCTLIFRNDECVLAPPQHVVEALVYSIEQTRIPTLPAEWIREDGWMAVSPHEMNATVWPGYEGNIESRLKFVLNDVLSHARSASHLDIYPSLPVVRMSDIQAMNLRDKTNGQAVRPHLSFYPVTGDSYTRTWSTEYMLPQGWIYEYRLHRVPKEKNSIVLGHLEAIERSRLYGDFGFSQEPGVTLPFLNESDRFAKYARVLDLTDGEIRSALRLDVENCYHGMIEGEKSIRLWAECAIPIDSDFIPIGQPERSLQPIALETNKALYLYSVEVVPQKAFGGMIEHFEGHVFDFSQSSNFEATAAAVIDELRRELTLVFESDPLSAKLVPIRAPKKMRFQRKFDESRVLQGLAGPYYELSTYTVTWWPGPAGSFAGSAELQSSWLSHEQYKDRVKSSDQLFLHVEHSLQIAVGRHGVYGEPSSLQYARYTDAVKVAIDRAVDQVIAKFGGRKRGDGVAVISSTKLE